VLEKLIVVFLRGALPQFLFNSDYDLGFLSSIPPNFPPPFFNRKSAMVSLKTFCQLSQNGTFDAPDFFFELSSFFFSLTQAFEKS